MTNREPGRRNDYRIDVDHFGPIQRASVDMRPFTVFIGPSNTGKSYLAVLIYALHRSLHMGYGWMPRTTTPGDELLQDLRSWAQAVHSERPVPSPPPNVAAHIDAVLKDAKWLESTFTAELRRCFGVDSLDALLDQLRDRGIGWYIGVMFKRVLALRQYAVAAAIGAAIGSSSLVFSSEPQGPQVLIERVQPLEDVAARYPSGVIVPLTGDSCPEGWSRLMAGDTPLFLAQGVFTDATGSLFDPRNGRPYASFSIMIACEKQ